MSQTKAQLISGTSSQDVTFDDATVSSLNGGALSGARNRIINGDMRIDQRNAGASVTINSSNNFYPVDRLACTGQATDGVFTVQRSTTAPSGFTNSVIATVTTADASIGATQQYLIAQFVEGFNIADLGWGAAGAQSVTLSFWVRSSLTGTFGGSLVNSAFNRSYPFSYTINAANTFEYKTVTITGDTTGTWLSDSGVGVRVFLSLGAGSTYLGTAGAWSGSYLIGPTGQTNIIATNGATFYITGVQLEAGSVATPFERRSYGQELALCQRYYFNGLQGVGGSCYNTADAVFCVRNVTTMRAAPTLSFSSGSTQSIDVTGASTFNVPNANFSFDRQTVNGFRMYTGSGSLGTRTLGQPVELLANTLQASAEL